MRPALALSDAPAHTLLTVYLDDHLAGAVVGLQLARRCHGNNRTNIVGHTLAELIPEIEQDRATLEQLMASLEIEPSRVKMVGATVAERVGRLKLNGQVLGYSDLSRLVELEGLSAGIAGKESLWRALRAVHEDEGPFHGVDLDRMIERAVSQRERVEELRKQAARTAFRGTVDAVRAPGA